MPKNSPSAHHRTTLSGYIFATRHLSTFDNHKKNLLNSNTSSTCPHNMANFGPLTAEISSWVLGTPANFNGFRVLAALLHGTLVVGVSQTLRRWTEAGRPSRALAHILVLSFFSSPNLSSHRLIVYHFHTWCGLSANLECRSEMCSRGSLKIQDTELTLTELEYKRRWHGLLVAQKVNKRYLTHWLKV